MAQRKRSVPRISKNRSSTSSSRGLEKDRRSYFWRDPRQVLLAACVALLVARTLYPSESASEFGDGAPLVLIWIALATCAAIICRDAPRWNFVDGAVAVLVGWHTFSSLVAVRRAAPRPALNMMWEWLVLGIGYFLMRQLARTSRDTRTIVACFLSLSVSLSALGLYQYFVTFPATRTLYHSDPDAALGSMGIHAPPGSRERLLFESRLETAEPTATFALTNSLAGFLLPWLLLGGVMLHDTWRRKERSSSVLISIAVLLSVIAACLWFTHSRTALLALAVGGTLLAVGAVRAGLGTKRSKFMVFAAAGLGGCIAVGVALTRWELVANAWRSFSFRLEYWLATWDMIQVFPIWGCGPGNFQSVYTQFKLPQASETVADPHHFLLEIAATAGVPAALAMVVAWTGLYFRVPRDFPIGDTADSAEDRQNEVFPLGSSALAIGWILGFLASSSATVPLSLEALASGMAVSLASFWLLRQWVDHGQLPRSVLAVAHGMLALNLLAAGGIGFPAVAGLFWTLAALLQVGETSKTCPISPRSRYGIGAACMIVLVACYTTMFRPFWHSQAAFAQAQAAWSRRDLPAALSWSREAVEADLWSARAARLLASTWWQRWLQTREEKDLERFEASVERAKRLDPFAAPLWQNIGHWYLAIYRQTGKEEALRRALSHYERAVELYPHGSQVWADWAWCLSVAGQTSEAQNAAREALRLDALNPHPEQDLRQYDISDPEAPAIGSAEERLRSILSDTSN